MKDAHKLFDGSTIPQDTDLKFRKSFEAWVDIHGARCDNRGDSYRIWQASRKQAIEECAKIADKWVGRVGNEIRKLK